MPQVNQDNCKTCGQKALLLSALNNVGLALLKGIVGFLTGSQALLADAMHSGADIICAMFGILGGWMSGKDVDKNHPYGYGKIEFVVGVLVGVVLLFAAGNILHSSIKMLFFSPNRVAHPPQPLAFWVALLSIYANLVVSRVTLCAAGRLNSPALKAISADNLSDAYSSIPVAIAVLGSQLGLPELDPLGALFVGLLIGRIAVGLVIENYKGIMDASAPKDQVSAIAETIRKMGGVEGISYLKTRLTGKSVWVDVQVIVDGDKSVNEADRICAEIKSALMRKMSTIGAVQVTLKPA